MCVNYYIIQFIRLKDNTKYFSHMHLDWHILIIFKNITKIHIP